MACNEYRARGLRGQFAAHVWDIIDAFEREGTNRRDMREALAHIANVPDDLWEKIRDHVGEDHA